MEKKLLPYLVVFSALSISLSAAFYSVTGIGKMFSGASVNVMIMMTFLEISKLVLASMLYQYWDKFSKLLRIYYFTAIFILMAITSAGIYGYLSAAYSETSTKVETIDKKISVMDIKRKMFQSQLDDIRNEKVSIIKNIDDLTRGITTNQRSYSTNTQNVQLKSIQKRRDEISSKEVILSDSISRIDLEKLSLSTNNDVSKEIGPLKYLAKLTNKSVDVVVNWFIIALMLVFDPLAISLVVGANIIFKKIRLKKEKEEKYSNIESKIDEYESLKELVEKEKIALDKEVLNFNDIKSKFLKREENINNMEESISNRENEIKENIENLKKIQEDYLLDKKEFEYQKEQFLIDKEEIESKIEKYEDDIKNLIEKENSLDHVKNELSKLDDEIKKWESSHWKMKRNPPPSAITD